MWESTLRIDLEIVVNLDPELRSTSCFKGNMSDDKVFNDLCLACRIGDIENVDKLLSTGVNVSILVMNYRLRPILTGFQRSIRWTDLIILPYFSPVCVVTSLL